MIIVNQTHAFMEVVETQIRDFCVYVKGITVAIDAISVSIVLIYSRNSIDISTPKIKSSCKMVQELITFTVSLVRYTTKHHCRYYYIEIHLLI